jgi:hypothetical protein
MLHTCPKPVESASLTTPAVHAACFRVVECRLLEEVLLAAARQFRAVKFLKIVSTNAVENWPDRNLPTLFVYHDGELSTQLLGLKKLGGRSTNLKGTWHCTNAWRPEGWIAVDSVEAMRSMIQRARVCAGVGG